MTLQQYLGKRTYWEVALVLAVVVISFIANLGTELIEHGRSGTDFDVSVPVILEGTSHVAMALSIPLLLWFDRLVPIRISNWFQSTISHIGFSLVFSAVHVLIMYWARVFIFSLPNYSTVYRWDNWLTEFLYEYLKDFRTYFLILALVYLYGFVIRRLQGEAGFLSDEKNEQSNAGSTDRFLVKKLGREFLVRIDEIEWIESCGNYVNLHVNGRVYPLRETMRRIDERLIPMGFQRVHRSAIVNLDRVAELVAFDSGDGEAKLVSDATVPVSRRFRQELRDRLS